MKMGKKGRKAVSSFSHVFSFSWISKIKRMAGKPSPAPPSGPVPTKQNASTPPGTPANGSESTPCRLQRGRFSESGRPMCSITNFAYSPEVLDKRTGRSVAGFVEPEEDFWRFSFRRQSFEWERHGHRVGEEWPPAEDRGRRAFSVDFDSSPHIRQGGKIADTVCRIVADARTESQDGDRWCKMTQPSPRKPEADERKQQPQSQSFPPLNLKRPQHQKFKDLKPRGDKGEGREPRDVSRRRKWLAQRSPGRGDLFSPRTICKIRAVEEMKRRKRKNNDNFNGNRGGHQREGRRGLEGFAVVKRSWDPQRDFRESMVEMISEGKMGDGEELEKLLACYLELNPAEFHDLIVKVFRQVWFDLNRDCALAASELERGYFDY